MDRLKFKNLCVELLYWAELVKCEYTDNIIVLFCLINFYLLYKKQTY